jgi:hypothetical protein
VVLGLAVIGAAAAGGSSGRSDPTPALTIAGTPEAVFVWQTDRCDRGHIPDAPARAMRDAAGQVHLFATHFVNRAMVGPSLAAVRPDCRVRFEGGRRDEPQAFDDRTWIAALYTADGIRVHALAHMEYQGHLRADACRAGSYLRCWHNAVVQLISADGGQSFQPAGDGRTPPLAAALPYPYDGRQTQRSGYFNPSNIIAKDGFVYAFVFAEAYGAQRRGACLMRTDTPDDPASWRAWDGEGFRVRFIDPYRAPAADAGRHVCQPLPGLPYTISSVVRHRDSGRFIAVMSGRIADGEDGPGTTGILYATSADLVRWSPPRLLLAAPLMYAFTCGVREVFAYPALLSEDSVSRSFETVGNHAHLYLTRFNLTGCRLTMDRDLIRFPVTVTLDASE